MNDFNHENILNAARDAFGEVYKRIDNRDILDFDTRGEVYDGVSLEGPDDESIAFYYFDDEEKWVFQVVRTRNTRCVDVLLQFEVDVDEITLRGLVYDKLYGFLFHMAASGALMLNWPLTTSDVE